MSQFRKLDLSKEEKDAKLQDLEARYGSYFNADYCPMTCFSLLSLSFFI